jgi:hypothetical protein
MCPSFISSLVIDCLVPKLLRLLLGQIAKRPLIPNNTPDHSLSITFADSLLPQSGVEISESDM